MGTSPLGVLWSRWLRWGGQLSAPTCGKSQVLWGGHTHPPAASAHAARLRVDSAGWTGPLRGASTRNIPPSRPSASGTDPRAPTVLTAPPRKTLLSPLHGWGRWRPKAAGEMPGGPL